jgi:hypothetical protein
MGRTGLIPSAKQIASGTFQNTDGKWYKRCAGPSHELPVYLPATEKYFYVRKSGRVGQLTSRCRLCTNWEKLKSPGSHHGWVPVEKARPIYLEAANRIGISELSRRTGVNSNAIQDAINRKSTFVQKASLRKIMLELISIRRKNESSINAQSRWRRDRRLNGEQRKCKGCGNSLRYKTMGCKTCMDRFQKWRKSGKITDKQFIDGYIDIFD